MGTMKTLSAVVIGAGDRGMRAYAPYALKFPHELKIVGVAEINPKRREQFQKMYGLEDGACFSRWEDLLKQPRMGISRSSVPRTGCTTSRRFGRWNGAIMYCWKSRCLPTLWNASQ
jgi:hypothetical protein